MVTDVLLADDSGAESMGEEGRFGYVVSGTERVAQNVIFTLMNSTSFPEDIFNCPTSYDVAMLFGACADDTKSIIAEQDRKAGHTGRDKLSAIELDKISYSGTDVTVYLNITTDDGSFTNDAVVINYTSKPSDY